MLTLGLTDLLINDYGLVMPKLRVCWNNLMQSIQHENCLFELPEEK